MTVVDERGRLFGRVNIVDALVGLFVLVLIPASYGAYRLFRTPVPTIAAIQPDHVEPHTALSLKITGENMRPFLRARFGSFESNGFLVMSPQEGEIRVPDLAPGTYDLTLFDEGQVLLVKPAALTVAVAAPPPPPTELHTIRVHVLARPEVASALSIGDVDVSDPQPANDDDRAVLIAIDGRRESASARSNVLVGPLRSDEVEEPLVGFNVTVRVPVKVTPTGWIYHRLPVKIGMAFAIETRTSFMEGRILALSADGPEKP